MSDYIKREDARGIINEYFKGKRTGNQIVDAIPAADVVERASGLVGEIPNAPVYFLPPHMSAAIEKVISERERQMELWGECSDNHPFEWMSILGEEFGELCEAVNETYFKNGAHPEYGGNEKIIKEAVHVAAVAVAIIESAIRAGEGCSMTREQIRDKYGIRQIEDPKRANEELSEKEAADYERGLLAIWAELKKGAGRC